MEFTGDERDYLLSIVDSLVFVDEEKTVDKYKCINCGTIAIKHFVANCKHVFCSICIRKVFLEMCPACRNVEISKISEDDEFGAGLLRLNVECRYKIYGCKERISLRKYRYHTTNCTFSTKALLPKIYHGPGASERTQTIAVDVHQLKTTIKDIGEKMKTMSQELARLSSQQEKETEAREIFEKEIAKKVDADEKPVSELNSIADSKAMLIKREFDDEKKLKKQDQLYVDFEELRENSTIYEWKITEFTQKLHDSNTNGLIAIKSPAFYIKDSGHAQVNAMLVLNGSRNAGNFPNGSSISSLSPDLEWNFSSQMFWYARKFTMIDQSDSFEKEHLIVTEAPYLGDQTIPNTVKRRQLIDISLFDKGSKYLKNDCIIIQVCIKPLTLMYKFVASNNGILVWPIENYSLQKQDQIMNNTCLKSAWFYTSPQGYKMYSHLHLNGHHNMKGRGITIFVFFTFGESYEIINCPTDCLVSFYLLDQSNSPEEQYICKSQSWSYEEYCNYKGVDLASHFDAEKPTYLKDNQLIFKITVQLL